MPPVAAAFRALKEGKWSTYFAAEMTNDEFFGIIGIPEMTTGPDPLIRKRDGCHRWKPEEFGPDDPRHGWTCWKDAVALLGNDKAVQGYVEGNEEQRVKEPNRTEPLIYMGSHCRPNRGSCSRQWSIGSQFFEPS